MPKLTEKEIIDALRSGQEFLERRMINSLAADQEFERTWRGHARKNRWDMEYGGMAKHDALMVFIKKVKTGEYQEGNWRAYCFTILKRRYFKRATARTLLRSNEEVSQNLTEPFSDDDDDELDLAALFSTAVQIKWFQKDPLRLLALQLWSEGYNYKQMKEKLNTPRNEASLRQDVTRGIKALREHLVRGLRGLLGDMHWCKASCSAIVNGHLDEQDPASICASHPDLQTSSNGELEAQYQKCLTCVAKHFLTN